MLRSAADRVGNDKGLRYYDTRDESEFIGYAELDSRSRAIADALIQLGHVPGEIVVLALDSDLEYIQAVYGLLYAGLAFAAAPVSANTAPKVMANDIARIAAASGARLVISQQAQLDKLRQLDESDLLDEVAVVTVAELAATGNAAAWVEPLIDGSTMAGLGFTSGSTGDPKGVIYTHTTMLQAVYAGERFLSTSQDAVVVGWSPLHHVMGLTVQVTLPVHLAGSGVFTSVAQFQRRPVFWLQLISEHRATLSAGANFAFALCTQLATDEQIAELDLSSLEVIVTGAEPVRLDTLHAFADRFAPTGFRESMIAPAYGSTEVTPVTAKRRGAAMVSLDIDVAALEAGRIVSASPDQRSMVVVSCGVPGPLSTLVIVDPSTGESLREGQVGEIWVAGPSLSPGYWQRPDATAEVFGARLADDDNSYYRTGDLGAVIDGELFVTGRLKDLIIVRGRNIYPQDIEAAAMRVRPHVGTGAAFELSGHPAEAGIALELADGAPTDRDGLSALSRELRMALMDEFSLPSLAIALLPAGSVPRTASGKVRRSMTRSMLEMGELPALHTDGFTPSVNENLRTVAVP